MKTLYFFRQILRLIHYFIGFLKHINFTQSYDLITKIHYHIAKSFIGLKH
jgi:hypothetical protein